MYLPSYLALTKPGLSFLRFLLISLGVPDFFEAHLVPFHKPGASAVAGPTDASLKKIPPEGLFSEFKTQSCFRAMPLTRSCLQSQSQYHLHYTRHELLTRHRSVRFFAFWLLRHKRAVNRCRRASSWVEGTEPNRRPTYL